MIRRPPRSTRTDTLFPYTRLFRARVKFVDYEEAQVYRIVGTFRTATQIGLSEDETIQHVALGDTVSWEVAVAGHILFLKPRERAGPTNLIVTTSRGGTLRSYAFELTARSGPITGRNGQKSEERRVGKECVSPCRYRG